MSVPLATDVTTLKHREKCLPLLHFISYDHTKFCFTADQSPVPLKSPDPVQCSTLITMVASTWHRLWHTPPTPTAPPRHSRCFMICSFPQFHVYTPVFIFVPLFSLYICAHRGFPLILMLIIHRHQFRFTGFIFTHFSTSGFVHFRFHSWFISVMATTFAIQRTTSFTFVFLSPPSMRRLVCLPRLHILHIGTHILGILASLHGNSCFCIQANTLAFGLAPWCSSSHYRIQARIPRSSHTSWRFHVFCRIHTCHSSNWFQLIAGDLFHILHMWRWHLDPSNATQSTALQWCDVFYSHPTPAHI